MDRPAPRPAPTRLGSGPRGRRGERRDWTRRRGRWERPRACAYRQSGGRRDPGRCAGGRRRALSPPPRLPPPPPRDPLESFAKNRGGATAGFSRGWLGSPLAAPHTASPDPPPVRDPIRIPYRGMLPCPARPRECPQRSGKSEGWLGEVGRFRPDARLPRPVAFAEGFGRSRLGRVQPFWWAILSPCLMTSRSARRAMGWAIRSRYLSQ